MGGLDRARLVMVQARAAGPGGELHVGTGYLVTADRVLTASHVVPEGGLASIEVRVEQTGRWHAVALQPAWRDSTLDALVLRLVDPLPALPPAVRAGDAPDALSDPEGLDGVAWVEQAFDADVAWHSSAYPGAGMVDLADGTTAWKTVGLNGQVQALGGGGQGPRELELTVEAASHPAQWAGISGAPVFVGHRLAGVIKEVPPGFDGQRLAAVPATALLQDPGFRLALARPWLEPLPEGVWVMVVQAEARKGKTGLADWVDGALSKHAAALESVIGPRLQPKALRVPICEAIASPGRWLRFVQALCAAPIVVFDATDFDQPAVMLAMGVRAVVRRGVTLTSTAKDLTPANLSKLPFNIQETKLIYHGSGHKTTDVRHPLIAIPAAIKRGWQEQASLPHYLDLPAYDAVRCPYPTADVDGRSAVDRMLVLCCFNADHEAHWLRLSNALVAYYPGAEAVRMLEVTSPRLVGQALYEGIRWARTCVVDWSGWRANVFFELGVRLACADIGPVNLIEQAEHDQALAAGAGSQKRLMIELLAPAAYPIDPDASAADADPIAAAMDRHDATARQAPPAVGARVLPHDATFRTCRDHFDWRQEAIARGPHDWLRTSIEAPFGKDRQAKGRNPALFSDNPEFGKDLERSIKERWLAAWYYLANRHPRTQWARDKVLRATLIRLGNDVLQFGLPKKPPEPHLAALRRQIYNTLEELAQLEALPDPDGADHASTP